MAYDFRVSASNIYYSNLVLCMGLSLNFEDTNYLKDLEKIIFFFNTDRNVSHSINWSFRNGRKGSILRNLYAYKIIHTPIMVLRNVSRSIEGSFCTG